MKLEKVWKKSLAAPVAVKSNQECFMVSSHWLLAAFKILPVAKTRVGLNRLIKMPLLNHGSQARQKIEQIVYSFYISLFPINPLSHSFADRCWWGYQLRAQCARSRQSVRLALSTAPSPRLFRVMAGEEFPFCFLWLRQWRIQVPGGLRHDESACPESKLVYLHPMEKV